jgi:hypothetical protein
MILSLSLLPADCRTSHPSELDRQSSASECEIIDFSHARCVRCRDCIRTKHLPAIDVCKTISKPPGCVHHCSTIRRATTCHGLPQSNRAGDSISENQEPGCEGLVCIVPGQYDDAVHASARQQLASHKHPLTNPPWLHHAAPWPCMVPIVSNALSVQRKIVSGKHYTEAALSRRGVVQRMQAARGTTQCLLHMVAAAR